MLSLCAVVGSTIAQVILNSTARHPVVKSRPLIMWEILILLLPLQIAGAGVGNLVNQIIPSLATGIFAIVVLLFTGYKVMVKGIATYKKEEIETHSKIAAALSDGVLEKPLQIEDQIKVEDTRTPQFIEEPMDSEDKKEEIKTHSKNTSALSDGVLEKPLQIAEQSKIEDAGTLQVIEEHKESEGSFCGSVFGADLIIEVLNPEEENERKQLPPLVMPWLYLKVFFLMWISYIVLSSCSKLLFDRCSLGYWLLYGLTFPPLFLTSWWGFGHIKAAQLAHPEDIVTGDLVFSEVGAQPLFFAFGVGVTGALIGVGGGILMTPLLLGLHITPNVASATTSTMSFTTGLTLLIQYAAAGEFAVAVGFWNMFLGFGGGFTGRFFALWFVYKYNRQSPITFAVAVVIVLAIGMLIYGLTILENGGEVSSYC
jgi:uncharacterized membrane protein YfcA